MSSKTWRYVKDYMIVDIDKVMEYTYKGYELVGGVAINDNVIVQAVVLYDDEVSKHSIKERDGE